MSHKVRLGPIAVFLAIVAVVLSTMVILTVSTTHADSVMAQRFASVISQRYALEAEGEAFLKEADEMAAAGALDAAALGAGESEDGITKTISENGYTLTVTAAPDASGGVTVKDWTMSKDWNADDPYQNIWKGE